MKTLKFLWIGLSLIQVLSAQTKEEILMTVDGEPVTSREFLRVYKKNLDLVQDESQKDVDGYLNLFVEYQLKLKEAKRLGLDEDAKYVREFNKYKKQLTKNYLSENKVTERLVKEAYERSTMDVRASHILVRLDANSNDTLNAYNEVLKLRQRVLDEGFEKVKSEAHDGKSVFLEDLGYFSAFKMVYEFENKAYETKVGDISMPFRTQFGYHAIWVKDKRKSKGTITAAHIMVATNQKDSTVIPEKRINEIYTKLNQGESFEALAKQFSDDKSSARNGGKLAPFKSGQLSSLEFENKAFALSDDGNLSTPFKTDYGWHIVKRLKLEEPKSFDEVKSQLENRIKRDSRSKVINKAMVEELKERYEIDSAANAKQDFVNSITDDYFTMKWELPEELKTDKPIFSINSQSSSYADFGKHLSLAQRRYAKKQASPQTIVNIEYDKFFEKAILDFREQNLINENEEFANILKEYRDGLLLFDLMEMEIWNKASKDSEGLETFYNNHKQNYRWPERVDVVMFSSAEKSSAKKAKQQLRNGLSAEDITQALNSDAQQNIIVTKGVFPITSDKLPEDFNAQKGVSDIYNHNEAFHVIDVRSVLPEGTKTFDEAKGSVINDYQTQLEKEWIASLRERFTVKIDEKVLNGIKKQLKK